MARAIRLPSSTVQSWKDRGSIPDSRKLSVLEEAQILGLDLAEKDFFPYSACSSEDAA